MVETVKGKDALPVGPDKHRTTVTLPKALLERVRAYRIEQH